MSRHIVRAITTVSRNGLVHWSSHAAFKFTNEQRTALEQCIEYFLHHNVDYPDPAIDLMSQHINSIDSIRTAEAHGTGLLWKWSLSSLSPATSRDFSLYNYSNDFSFYMRGLHDLLLERIGNNPWMTTVYEPQYWCLRPELDPTTLFPFPIECATSPLRPPVPTSMFAVTTTAMS